MLYVEQEATSSSYSDQRSRTIDIPDEELASRIRQGDSRAWTELLRRYSDFVYSKAFKYSQTGYLWNSRDDQADEVGELYLFIVERLKKSFISFRGGCKVKTWIFGIINDRRQIVKAYLLRKYPHKADIRPPKVIRDRADTDRKIYRLLVWGLLPEQVAWELGLSEAERRCEVILALVREKSPRVYERLMENRSAEFPTLSLDRIMEEDEGRRRYEPVSVLPTPEQEVIAKESREIILSAVQESLDAFSRDERRLFFLLYAQNMTPGEIAKSADVLRLPAVARDKQVYYRRDKALGKMAENLQRRLKELKSQGAECPKPAKTKKMLDLLEEILRERGASGTLK